MPRWPVRTQVPVPGAGPAPQAGAGELLTRVEDAIGAAARGGVDQLGDGERQFLRRETFQGGVRAEELTQPLLVVIIVSFPREASSWALPLRSRGTAVDLRTPRDTATTWAGASGGDPGQETLRHLAELISAANR